MKVLVTGGAGFMGSAFLRLAYAQTDWTLINIDKLSYAGDPNNVGPALANSPRYIFVKEDINHTEALRLLLQTHQPQAIVHLAAESHVDRSINGPEAFLQSNIVGTFTLLEATLRYWRSLSAKAKATFRFLHVSTDEVYGSLGQEGEFAEDSPYRPNSPYSATKAASDHLVRAWHSTYGLPVITTHGSNNYGPYQFPEKLIPVIILNAIAQQEIPIFGDGTQVRDWLYVDDHAAALLLILQKADPGKVYNIGGGCELNNLAVFEHVCDALDGLSPRADGESYKKLLRFVKDRPGHDQRYALNTERLRGDLKWSSVETFATGIRKTICWYLQNEDWCHRQQQKVQGRR